MGQMGLMGQMGEDMVKKVILVLGMLMIVACGQAEIKPVDFYPEDMCSSCRMAISEKQFAGEIITREGTALKFDDLRCMRKYLKDRGTEQVAGYFFIDYDGRNWINGRDVILMRSPEISAPMGGNTVAFLTRAKAEAAAAKYQGQVLSFTDFFEK